MKINLEDLYFSYPSGVQALQGVTCTIASGEQVAIVGQNGSGKTTLVKHLNGLLKPSRGKVEIGGWDTTQKTVAAMSARVGYVFQNPDEQLFTKSVYQEVVFGPQNLGFDDHKVQQLADQALAITDLTEERDTNPYDLSPTWRKMVALASIISMDTPIVILDEPTTGQDAASINRIAEVVNTLRNEGKTVITISHDIDFCAENFSRIIALSDGKILKDGPTRDVLSQDQILKETYVDPPQITRLGKELGFPTTVIDETDFLAVLQELVSTG